MDLTRDVRFRGKARLARLLPSSGRRAAKVFGAEMVLDLSDFIERHIYAGTYEPLNIHRFRRILRSGDTLIDVGANIGVFTVLGAQIVGPTGRVIAVEPHPDNARDLRETVERNGLAQVTVVECGLDESIGTGQIGAVAHALFPVRTATMMPGSGPSFPVPTTTLDALVAQLKLPRVDLLKIDVDGYESRVLRGAHGTLRARLVRNVIVEFLDHWIRASGSSESELLALLSDGGLREQTDPIASALFGPRPDRVFGM